MQIRLATGNDIPVIVSMAIAFRNHLERSAPTDAEFAQSIATLVETSDAEFFIATKDAHATGYVLQRYRHSMWANGVEATIEDLFVDPVVRKQGTGKALIEFALHRARQKRCTSVCLDTNEFNAASTKIYTSLGFNAVSKRWNGRQIFFRKSLDQTISGMHTAQSEGTKL